MASACEEVGGEEERRSHLVIYSKQQELVKRTICFLAETKQPALTRGLQWLQEDPGFFTTRNKTLGQKRPRETQTLFYRGLPRGSGGFGVSHIIVECGL